MGNTSITTETIYTSTNVDIKPEVTIGKTKTACVGEPKLTPCKNRDCTYEVDQLVHVHFPMTFSSQANKKHPPVNCSNWHKSNKSWRIRRICTLFLALCWGFKFPR